MVFAHPEIRRFVELVAFCPAHGKVDLQNVFLLQLLFNAGDLHGLREIPGIDVGRNLQDKVRDDPVVIKDGIQRPFQKWAHRVDGPGSPLRRTDHNDRMILM